LFSPFAVLYKSSIVLWLDGEEFSVVQVRVKENGETVITTVVTAATITTITTVTTTTVTTVATVLAMDDQVPWGWYLAPGNSLWCFCRHQGYSDNSLEKGNYQEQHYIDDTMSQGHSEE